MDVTGRGNREDWWNALYRFIGDMSDKLEANSHKPGWASLTFQELLKRMKAEVNELERAISSGNMREVMLEAADVANFAMFIADVAWADNKWGDTANV